MEGSVKSESNKSDKPLSVGQAAFLLLRVRKVFKKKIAVKKEKNSSFAQDVVFPKAELTQVTKSKKSRIPPLIRSRTVPAIIVPFSILQAQLAKNAGGSTSTASPNSFNPNPQSQSKSDFATPGVDYVQFLTGGSGSPAGTPPSRRDPHFLGLSNPSIYRDSGSGDSSWNVNLSTPSNISSSSIANISPSEFPTSVHTHSNQFPHFTGGGSRGLSRFARLLNSQPGATGVKNPGVNSNLNQQQVQITQWGGVGGSSGHGVDATFALGTPRLPRRRRSLENEDWSGVRPRAVSIDSLLKTPTFLCTDASGKGIQPKRFSTCSVSPNLNRDRVEQRIAEGFVTAVENGNVSKVKTILETNDVDINSLTADGLTLLDVAVIQRNRPMVKLLLSNGATENQYCRKESINDQLERVVQEAEKKSEDLMSRILKCSTFGNLSPLQMKELEKEFHFWEKRFKKFLKMRNEFVQIRPPDVPSKVTLDVIGSTSVKIRLQEDESEDNSISTKYKIEWSSAEDFKAGKMTRVLEILDLRRMETVLNDLTSGTRYYFRVACGNLKGYGLFQNCTPLSAIPSSWRDIDGKRGRYTGKSIIFDDIFNQIREARPEYALSEIRGIDFPEVGPLGGNYSNQQKKNQKIISIKQLFAAAPKFQKHIKRGVFLCCVIYSEDKLLVTTEEFLPIVEIDESFPSSLQNDFHWLLKVACTWEDVKSLKQDMEKSGSASTFHFRLKLLQAAAAMQNALGIGDLGRLYYKTIRDKSNSVVVISTINYMRSTKLISSLNARWAPITKMSSRKSTDDISDILINSIQDQILYHQVSNIPLGKGLYLGYLKLASSVDVLKIVVPEKTPNILPHAKIRDNPHVSSEEWTMIQRMVKAKSVDSLNFIENNNNMNMDNGIEREEGQAQTPLVIVDNASDQVSEAQELFRSQLVAALRKLFSFLEIDYESSLTHRLYNAEVLEVNNSVSLIVVSPALESVCLVAGQSEKLLQRNDLIPLPVQVFEMIHLNTYQKEFITRYARLSAILEVDTILALHNQREAFSAEEVSLAKLRLSQLQDFQSRLDSNWRCSRWVIDLVTISRDKSTTSASIRSLIQYDQDLKTSSESIVSADACLRKSEQIQLGLHSRSDQELLPFGGLKFSRSENQLANIASGSGSMTELGQSCGANSTSHPRNLHFHPTHPAGGRKVSVPVHSIGTAQAVGIQEKLQFNPKIYSNHSQSDSTISITVSSAEQLCGGSSLHNLYRPSSSSQIVIPSVVVSSDSTTTAAEPTPVSPIPPVLAPSPVEEVVSKPVYVKTHTRIGSEPPPVPPRRTIPPNVTPIPPPLKPTSDNLDLRVFSAVDPIVPTVSVELSGSSAEEEPCFSGTSRFSRSCASAGDQLVEFRIAPERPIDVEQPGVIQVFAAYECGLADGTCVRLKITSSTTARQVVDLVVKQLNAEVEAKGLVGPIYDRSQEFCLVAVIGARERCLRNDFKPLHLQSPWKTGRLYIRKKNDVTAAIAMNGRTETTYL